MKHNRKTLLLREYPSTMHWKQRRLRKIKIIKKEISYDILEREIKTFMKKIKNYLFC